MKKITLLLMAVLAWVGSVSAQEAQSLLNFSWAHTVEGAANASNNVFEAQKAADGSYFVANKIGTKTGALTAKFDGTAIDKIGKKDDNKQTQEDKSINKFCINSIIKVIQKN